MSLLSENLFVELIAIFAVALATLYFYFSRNYNYWKNRGVPFVKPIPFLGNFYKCAAMKTTVGEFLTELYNKMEDAPFFGIFVFDKPFLIVKCPDLVKSILVKDFNYFQNRTVLSNKKYDAITAHMLFFEDNPEWKVIRTKLTPVFTSGKMKNMFHLINEVGIDMKKFIVKNVLGKEFVEAKEMCAKYSTDVVTSCAFGINAHSFECENADFRVIGRQMFDFTTRNAIHQTSYFFLPSLVKLFRMSFLPHSATNFLRNVFWQQIKDREATNFKRNDLIDIIIQLRKNKDFCNETKFENDKVVAQAAQFFAAGFETTSSTIAFTLYELCLNKDLQDRLRNEIVNVIRKHDGVTYDSVQEMPYLHQCVLETLRKYPVLPFLDRTCLQDYKIPGSDVVIEKGTPVYIPMFGLHYDPKYFPDPQKYDPERFSENNKQDRHPFSYIPFGEGPRICIGERFGLLGAKLALIHILSEFEVERCSKTPVPLVFAPKSFVLASTVGLPMKFNSISTVAA